MIRVRRVKLKPKIRKEVIGDATLYLGDCNDVLPLLDKVDAVITDPPYGIGIKTTNAARGFRPYDSGFRPYDSKAKALDFKPVYGDKKPFDPKILMQYKSVILWGANHYANALPPSHFWLCWDRKAGKAANSNITDCELAWVKGQNYVTVRMFRHMWAGFQRDSEVGQEHLHPTQKPVALFEWCLQYVMAGTIVDPYMGSGPIGVACMNLNRKFIGIEIDPKYFDIACERIARAYKDPKLFTFEIPKKKKGKEKGMFGK